MENENSSKYVMCKTGTSNYFQVKCDNTIKFTQLLYFLMIFRLSEVESKKRIRFFALFSTNRCTGGWNCCLPRDIIGLLLKSIHE